MCTEKDFTHTEKLVSYYANLFAAILSVCGAFVIIFSYVGSPQIERSRTLTKLILCLSLADLCSSGGVAISQAFLMIAPEDYSNIACITLRCIIQFGFVAAFFWTTTIAVFLYREISNFEQESRPFNMILAQIFCWGVPGALVAVILGGKYVIVDPNNHWCSTTEFAEWTFWLAPLILSFLCNSILYLMILRIIRKRTRNSHLLNLNVEK